MRREVWGALMVLWGQVAGCNPLPRVFAFAGALSLCMQAFWHAKSPVSRNLSSACAFLYAAAKPLLSCDARAAGVLPTTISSCDGLTGASILVAYARWFDGLADLGRRVTITMRIFLIRRHTVLPFVLNDQLKSECA